MADLAVSNTFVDGNVITAAGHNTNNSDIVNYINNRNNGTSTWDALRVTTSSAVVAVLNNSSGSSNILNCQDNGTNVLSVADGGGTTLTATAGGSSTALTVNNNTSTGSILVCQDNGSTFFIIADGGKIGAGGVTTPLAYLNVADGNTGNTAGDANNALSVYGSNLGTTSARGNIMVQSVDALAADMGGSIALGGRYLDAQAAGATFAQIKAGKTNATTNNVSGYLTFSTRDNSAGIREIMRINNAGIVSIGTTAPSADAKFVAGNTTNLAGIEIRTDGADIGGAGGANVSRVGGWYQTNTIAGSAIHFAAQGGSGQRGAIGFLTKVADDNTTQPSLKMVITQAGDVGIGATNPGTKLEVAGNILVSGSATMDIYAQVGTALRIRNTTVVQIDYDSDNDGSGSFAVRKATTERLAVNNAGITTIASQSAARAFKSAAPQTLTTGTDTKVVLDGESYDVQSEFDSATNYRFTATVAGKYEINARVTFGTSAGSGSANVHVRKNGDANPVCRAIAQKVAGETPTLMLADTLSLDATDYIEMWAYQATGGNCDVLETVYNTTFSVHKIS